MPRAPCLSPGTSGSVSRAFQSLAGGSSVKIVSVPSNAAADECWGLACSSGGWKGRQARVGAADETPHGEGLPFRPPCSPRAPLTSQKSTMIRAGPIPDPASPTAKYLPPGHVGSWIRPLQIRNPSGQTHSPAQGPGSLCPQLGPGAPGAGPYLESVAAPAAGWGPSSLPPFSFLGLTAVRKHCSPLARRDDGTQMAPAGWDWRLLDAGPGIQSTWTEGPHCHALLQRPQYSILTPRGPETSRQGL